MVNIDDNEENGQGDRSDKVKVELEREIVNRLLKRKEIGMTYSDIIRQILDKIEQKEGEKDGK